MTYQMFEAGDTVYKEGDTSDKMYIILKGKVQVSVKDKDQMMEKRKSEEDNVFITNVDL